MSDIWIQTYKGKKFSLTDPQPEMVCIEDIAKALSNTCRFGGHVKSFYSVAEHSYHMASIAKPIEMKLYALLHDAGEAYYGDIPSPLKGLIRKCINPVAQEINRVVDKSFGLASESNKWDIIHHMDLRMLITERNQLMGEPPEPWENEPEPYELELPCYNPYEIEEMFLDMFEVLTGDGDFARLLLNTGGT